MSRMVLPKSPQATQWVHSTDRLRTRLRADLETIQQRVDAKLAEAHAIEATRSQLTAAIELLDQLLPGKTTPKSDPCVECGDTARTIQGRGLCRKCYYRVRRAELMSAARLKVTA